MNLQTVRTVCEELGVPEIRVRRAIEAGKLDTMKLGCRTLVDLDTARDALLTPAVEEGATIADVIRETGLKETAVRRGIREGWIPCEKPGKSYVFDLEAVKKAIRKRMKQKQQK